MSEEKIKKEEAAHFHKSSEETQEIFQIIDRFEASDITRLRLKQGDMLLELEKPGECLKIPKPLEKGGTEDVDRTTQKPAAEKATEIISDEAEGTPVESPIAGVFYAAPSPGAKHYVTVGQHVKKGDVVGLVEAMKMMNEIVAPVSGVIKTIEVKNEDFVEYKQSLMIISR